MDTEILHQEEVDLDPEIMEEESEVVVDSKIGMTMIEEEVDQWMEETTMTEATGKTTEVVDTVVIEIEETTVMIDTAAEIEAAMTEEAVVASVVETETIETKIEEEDLVVEIEVTIEEAAVGSEVVATEKRWDASSAKN